MAIFTMELRDVMDIQQDIGLNVYPIWDDEYRAPLNQKIIDHYLMREIGMETIDRFTHAMRRRMNEAMPYFNQLYRSTQLEFDPLLSMRIHNVVTGTATGEVEATADSTNSTTGLTGSQSVSSDFPQTLLSENGDYATNGSRVESDSTNTGTGNNTSSSNSANTQNSDSLTEGYTSSPAILLAQYRATLLNIDMDVIDSLRDCFMTVWTNGDSYNTLGRIYF